MNALFLSLLKNPINPLSLNISQPSPHSSNRTFYNRIAPFYSLIDAQLSRYKQPLINQLNALPSGDLLCLGVGFGKELKKLQKHRIIGIDHSEKMLAKAQKFNPSITLKCMKAEQTTFKKETFDYIVLAHILSTGNQSEQMLTEADRLLKKNGKIFILNHFTPKNFLGLVDRIFQPISKIFHFQSAFYLASLPLKKSLKIADIESIGRWNYYQLITLIKQND